MLELDGPFSSVCQFIANTFIIIARRTGETRSSLRFATAPPTRSRS